MDFTSDFDYRPIYHDTTLCQLQAAINYKNNMLYFHLIVLMCHIAFFPQENVEQNVWNYLLFLNVILLINLSREIPRNVKTIKNVV